MAKLDNKIKDIEADYKFVMWKMDIERRCEAYVAEEKRKDALDGRSKNLSTPTPR